MFSKNKDITMITRVLQRQRMSERNDFLAIVQGGVRARNIMDEPQDLVLSQRMLAGRLIGSHHHEGVEASLAEAVRLDGDVGLLEQRQCFQEVAARNDVPSGLAKSDDQIDGGRERLGQHVGNDAVDLHEGTHELVEALLHPLG